MNRAVREVGVSAVLVIVATAAVFEIGTPFWAGVESRYGGTVLLLLSGSVFVLFGAVLAGLSNVQPKHILAGAAVVYVLWPVGVELLFGPTDIPVLFIFGAVLWIAIALGVGAAGVNDRHGDTAS